LNNPALSSLFDYLCERNAVAGNPVDGVKRPMANGNEGSTPALGDAQACKLLEAPPAHTLKGVRDRAILATLVYWCRSRQSRQGVMHLRVKGKRDKVRFVPAHAMAQRLIEEYLAVAGHGADTAVPVFRPVTNNRTGDLDRPLSPGSVYHNIVRKYGLETGISAEVKRVVCPFAARYCGDQRALA
jgi:integrase/recombinase XerD